MDKLLGLKSNEFQSLGYDIKKLSLDVLDRPSKGKLVLMTSINPTPAGEGKTTLNIGLSMALNRLGKTAVSCLREPALGPNFGMKGPATGGGKCEVLPTEMINLHFTGDFHAVTSAHNLLAALVDNHVFHGNELNVDKVILKRVMDMNDRSLRRIQLLNGQESGFDLSVTSEIMAILCLSKSLEEMEERLSRMIVAYDHDGKALMAKDFDAVHGMMRLLNEAIKPNLVKTSEGTPALIHGGPFANIAHGCNSLLATEMGLRLADFAVTEAGFGADLGAEKFFNIKCRQGNLDVAAVVIVVSIKALKINGGQALEDLDNENLSALEEGFKHLNKHIENCKKFNDNVLITTNVFDTDTQDELELFQKTYPEATLSYAFTQGGQGVEDLAQQIIDKTMVESSSRFLYPCALNYVDKIKTIAKELYGASSVEIPQEVVDQLNALDNQEMQVCIAKTQYSFSNDPKLLGVPKDFTIKVTGINPCNGAGFVVVRLGNILTMPGLPKTPRGLHP
ncbi:MAG TPA: formate--tetrahydrofolate ligase [Erysipelothrix sp.]|nr:formate--tetrahydrofolate ligase [Erysipelothrix sp.]